MTGSSHHYYTFPTWKKGQLRATQLLSTGLCFEPVAQTDQSGNITGGGDHKDGNNPVDDELFMNSFFNFSYTRIIIILFTCLILLVILFYNRLCIFDRNTNNQPLIKNLPQIPGWPLFGNLLQLRGKTHAFTYAKWADQYGSVFQIRLGCKRLVIVNSYKAAKELWVNHKMANASRPVSYTFHKVVSSTQGLTIGTTPWSDSYKRKRKVAGRALNRPAVNSYLRIIDTESAYCIKQLLTQTVNTAEDDGIIVHPFFRTYALNTSLSFNYGTRLDEIHESTIREIITVEKQVSRFRSAGNNYQDYLPFLRVFGTWSQPAHHIRARRDVYMDMLLSKLKQEIFDGTDRPCITGKILKDPSRSKVSKEELKSICLTMVSAGLDTVPTMLIYFLGHMSQPGYGQAIQQEAYSEICETYPNDAWSACLEADNLTYIKALVHETLRFGAMPISLPRETIKDIDYHGCIIPSGTTMILNSFCADFDSCHLRTLMSLTPAGISIPMAIS